MLVKLSALAVMLLSLAGCSAERATSPNRSAQETLLISVAADRAAEALAAQVPSNLTAWIDASGFSAEDQAYGMAAIQDALLRHGVRLVTERSRADAIILPRAGMLSSYERNTLIGVPALPLPVAPGVTMPSLSLYSQNVAKGSAKFAASVYDPRTGKLIVSTDPAYGFSRQSNGTVLFFFTWHKNDLGVDFVEDPPQVHK